MPPVRIDALLTSIYENPAHPASFSSPYKLYVAAKKKRPRISFKAVEDWLTSKDSYTLHRKSKVNFRRRKVLVRGLFYQYQADLLDMQTLWHQNGGTRYILTVIDCFSRYASAIPLKNKRAPTVRDGFIRVFLDMKVPKKMQTDQGTEFYNSDVKRLFKNLGILHFSTDQELKASMVERFNRTLREKIRKYLTAKRTKHYLTVLPDLVRAYNKSPHSSLDGLAPIEVTKQNENQVRELLYGDYLREKKRRQKFKVNDVVRVTNL